MIGSSLSHYRITAKLGQGGMGEVYRATDENLGRDVAIKVLPDEVAKDAERLARFRREAHLLASLNHTNIAAIHGLEETEGKPFLVLELVQGEDLSERLKRGAIPVDEAIEIALQIAEALENAHEHGIIHRDLKPANIKLAPEGGVKVLDFGLAKALSAEESHAPDVSQSPTMSAQATQAGLILGTAAYMAPEQAKGQAVDRRADIWAFGVVLHEMLTGARLFASDTVAETLAGVLKSDINLEAVPAGVPPALRRLLDRCLERKPRQRLRDIGEARIILENLRAGSDQDTANASPLARQRSGVAPWAAATAIAGAAILGFVAHLALVPRAEPRVVRTSVLPAAGTEFYLVAANPGPVSLSPDGRFLAFTATPEDGAQTLWVRSVDELEPRELPGTDGAMYPFWSPDSKFLGFFTRGSLKKIAVAGGPAVHLCETPNGKGGSWSPSGVIVFPVGPTSPLSVVPAGGGAPRELTTLAPGESSHRHPRFLPDGEHFLFVARRDSGVPLLRAGSLDGTPSVPIVDTQANAEYANGQLLFVRDRRLVAQPFDAGRLELSGEAVPLVENIMMIDVAELAFFSVSRDAALAYQAGARRAENRLVWRDGAGQELGTLGDPGLLRNPSISRDGKHVAVADGRGGNADVWIYDVEHNLPRRFTFDPTIDGRPIWSPDGQTLAFASRRGGSSGIWSAPIAGTAETRLIAATQRPLTPLAWAPNGAELILHESGGEADLVAVASEGGQPRPLLATKFTGATDAAISPDGRWLAYESLETGRSEIYVTTFPTPGRKWQLTTEGGRQPRWPGDGRRLFYRDDRGLYATEVNGRGDTFVTGAATRLFDLPPRFAAYRQWDVTSDGERFLIVEPASGDNLPPITLVLNWDAELQKR